MLRTPLLSMDTEELVLRARDNDPQAFDTLYKTYFPLMKGVCMKMVKGDASLADDLVHDAFVLAFASLGSLRIPSRFGEWLTTIVRNVTLRYLERRERMPIVPLDEIHGCDTVSDRTDNTDSAAMLADINRLIECLPEGYRKVFRMSVVEGFSHKEIAAMLDIEPHSSSSQLARAKAMLRRMIDRRALIVLLLILAAIPLYIYRVLEKSSVLPDGGITHDKGGARQPDISPRDSLDGLPCGINKAVRRKHTTVAVADTTVSADTLRAVLIHEENEFAALPSDTNSIADTLLPHTVIPAEDFVELPEQRKQRPWQMFATGSLGPLLAQSVYRMVSTGGLVGGAEDASGIGNSGQPSVPEHITTWEDYSRYLQHVWHENMSDDSLAIMQIAEHNSGDIIETERHDRPVTFALSLTKAVSDRWNVETGLQYSILRSRFTTGINDYHIGRNQRIDYIGIPLRASRRMVSVKNFALYSAAGMAVHIPVRSTSTASYVVGDTARYTERRHIAPPLQWSVDVSVGLQYHLLPHVGIYIEPTLRWYIPTGSRIHTSWTERPVSFTVPLGVRFDW